MEKIPALTFSRGLVLQTRTGRFFKGLGRWRWGGGGGQRQGPERGSERKRKKKRTESAKSVSSMSSLPGTPQINTPSCVFSSSSTSACPPSHHQPQGYSRGEAWLHSLCLETVLPPRCLTVCLPRRSALKAKAPRYK